MNVSATGKAPLGAVAGPAGKEPQPSHLATLQLHLDQVLDQQVLLCNVHR